MQPLGPVDLALNIFIAVGFPLIIAANVWNWGPRSPLNGYMWREEPSLMRVSLVVIALLALFAYVQLALHFGLLSAPYDNVAMAVIGVPFAIAAVAEIWLAVGALRRYLRARQSA